jgi:peptidoglycan/LPS O-acetylase OafA/YrhL
MVVALTGSRLSGRHVLATGVHVLTFATNAWSIGDAPGLAAIVDRLGEPVPEVGHTWSLSIEAQFYVLWGLILWAATRARWSSARLASLCGSLIALVAIGRVIRMLTGPDQVWFTLYYTTAGRLDAPLIGALVGIAFCAGWLDRIAPRRAAVAATVGLVAFLLAGFTFEASTRALYYGLYTVLAFCGAAIIVGVLRAPTSRIPTLLTWRPLRFLGTISYSVYVWHYGMFLFVQREEWGFSGRRWDVPSPVVMVVALSVVLVVSWLSYHFVERPFLRSRKPQRIAVRDEAPVEPATVPVPP